MTNPVPGNPTATLPSSSFNRVDATADLRSRASRAVDHVQENRALVALAEEMAKSPRNVLQKLAEAALELCKAHSSGISLLEDNGDHPLFRWEAVAGQWAAYLGGTMPRHSSPCGTVLDRDDSLLLVSPEKFYPIPPEVAPSIAEVLLIPFHVRGRPVGTVWVIAHDHSVKFDAEDERVMRNLGKFASSAYQALATLEALSESEARYRALVHATTNSVWRMSGDGESMLELKSEIATPHLLTSGPTRQWLQSYVPEEDRARVGADWARAIATRAAYEIEHRAIAADGSTRVWLSRAIPQFDAQGAIREWIGASTDITERKRAEQQLRNTLADLELRVAARTTELADRNQRLKNEIAERLKAEAARMQAVQSLVEAEDSERRTISRELHDRVGQELTALSLDLNRLRPSLDAAGREQLAHLHTMIEAISKGVHDLALELRPAALDDPGLVPALESHVQEWSHRTGVRADFRHSAFSARVPAAIETTLYRLAQEALVNIARHAKATHVAVVLHREGNRIELTVKDDGVGFDVARALDPRVTKRLGLRGMIERATLCGGELRIDSQPQRGTTIFCHLMIPPTDSPHAETTHIPRR